MEEVERSVIRSRELAVMYSLKNDVMVVSVTGMVGGVRKAGEVGGAADDGVSLGQLELVLHQLPDWVGDAGREAVQ